MHLGGEEADAVVAEHGGRRAAARVDEPHARAVDGLTRLRIEHDAERVDERRRRRRVGGVERVDVARRERAVALHVEHAIADGGRGGARLHVAREAPGVDGRLGEHERLAVAADGADRELDAVDRGRVAVAIGVDELEEHGFAAVHDDAPRRAGDSGRAGTVGRCCLAAAARARSSRR